MNKDIYFNSTIMTVEELRAFTNHVERLEELDTKRVYLNNLLLTLVECELK